MPFFVALCALVGAFFLLPFLPTLIFAILTIYGALKLLEAKLDSFKNHNDTDQRSHPPEPAAKPPEPPSTPTP
jgi:hypothetical protein